MSDHSRRTFLALAGSAAAVASLPGSLAQAAESGKPHEPLANKPALNLGMASYSLREFHLDQALEMTRRVDLPRISLKDMHFPLTSTEAEAAALVAKVKHAGLELSTIGVVYMTSDEEVRRAFTLARWAGIKFIVGAPDERLLPLAERMVKETGIGLALHNHGPDNPLYSSPEIAYRRVEKLDRRMGLCIDVGHTQRLGIDPAGELLRFADRVIDMHIKDTSAADKSGTTVEIGRGVVDIPKLLRTAVKLGYTGTMHFEHEKDPQDPLPGIAESVGYVRGVLAAL